MWLVGLPPNRSLFHKLGWCMAYEVLARRWRPQNFQQLVGQQHVVRALTNALDQQRLHHAYLFTGTRGVGKTTLARILAKCLNCEQAISASPCGTCDTCQAIQHGNCLDLLEIDAASKTGVEDMRDLISNVQYSPNHARYKIYLIDEVHMLSKHSFNALLKTLEEPPAHVVFILATTDPQKLPITILSRCLQFHLKNLSIEQISQHLATILEAESIPFEKAALETLAEAADGSVRDSLSLLDQTIAHSDTTLKLSDVQALLGLSEQETVYRLLQQLQQSNGLGLLETVAELAHQAADFHHVLEQLLKVLHQVAVQQTVPEIISAEAIQQLAKGWSKEDTQVYYQIALIGRRDLPLAPTPKSGFEMVLLRMLAFRPIEHTAAPEPQSAMSPTAQPAQSTPTQTLATVPCENDWNTLYPQLKLSGIAKTLASYCIMVERSDKAIKLCIESSQATLVNNTHIKTIETAINQQLGQAIKLTIEPGETHLPSPFNLAKQAAEKKHQQAVEAINQDPHLNQILNQFDGTIEKGSIAAID